MVLDVGREDLVDDDETDDEGHNDAEAEDETDGGLLGLVVLFGVDELLFGHSDGVAFGEEGVDFLGDFLGVGTGGEVDEGERGGAGLSIAEESHEGVSRDNDAAVVAEAAALRKCADEMKLKVVEFEVVAAFFEDGFGDVGVELAGLDIEDGFVGLFEFREFGLDRFIDEDRVGGIGRNAENAELCGVAADGVGPEDLTDVNGVCREDGGVALGLVNASSRKRGGFPQGEEV